MRRGFTLLELVAVMTVLTLVMALSCVIAVTTVRLGRSGAASLQSLLAYKELADQFRADVASATEAPAEFGRRKAGPACLLLKNPKGDCIVYEWDSQRLERSLLTNGDPERRRLTTGSEAVVPHFDRSGLDRGIVTLRLIDSRPSPGRVVEISAAVGGDLR
jgi:prepilin-type N-terminal cleavage/methylation domain-containing protein